MSERHDKFCALYSDMHPDVQKLFPSFDYRKREGLNLNYSDPKNVVGHQQRAMTCWWAIEKCAPLDLGLDFGSHRGLTPLTIHVDKWYDNANDHPIYGGKIPTDIIADVSDPEHLKRFSPRTFPCIVSSHSLEHMPGPDSKVIELLCRWHNLLRQGGVIAGIVPDQAFVNVMGVDKDHKSAWSNQDFGARIIDPFTAATGARLVSFNTLHNNYSFDFVFERTAS